MKSLIILFGFQTGGSGGCGKAPQLPGLCCLLCRDGSHGRTPFSRSVMVQKTHTHPRNPGRKHTAGPLSLQGFIPGWVFCSKGEEKKK